MKCPNCYSDVPASASKCPRCDWSLRAAPSQPNSDPIWNNAEFDQAATWNPASSSQSWQPSSQPANPMPTNEWGEMPKTPVWDQAQPVNQPMQPVQAPPDQWDAMRSSIGGVMPRTVPLTGGQKTQLLLTGLLPLIVMIGFVIFFSRGFSTRGMPFFVPVIFGLIALFFVYLAVQSTRDLMAGVANVETLRLEQVTRTRQKNSYNYHAYFEKLGRMSSNRTFYENARQGGIYEVTYSPNSKRMWNAVLVADSAPSFPPV